MLLPALMAERALWRLMAGVIRWRRSRLHAQLAKYAPVTARVARRVETAILFVTLRLYATRLAIVCRRVVMRAAQ